jgi:uncharacterized protein (TIGR03435 family)
MRFLPQSILFAVVLTAGAGFSQTATSSITPIQPMAADAHPSFAVATIKPHDPASPHQGFDAHGDLITIRNESVISLMMFAYSIHKHQIANLPEWASGPTYDIVGKCDTPGQPNLRQLQETIQRLLADRFQLSFHRERRQMPIFAIRVAKGGVKLKPAAEPDADADEFGNGHGTEQTVTFKSARMADFALNEQFFLDRPVVDQTDLAGRYDFSVRYTYDESKTTDPNAPPGLFTAVQEQLGLRFVPTEGAVDVFVIDHVEKPSAN